MHACDILHEFACLLFSNMSNISSTYSKLIISPQEQRRRCEALAQPKALPNRSGDLVPSRKVVGGGFGYVSV